MMSGASHKPSITIQILAAEKAVNILKRRKSIKVASGTVQRHLKKSGFDTIKRQNEPFLTEHMKKRVEFCLGKRNFFV